LKTIIISAANEGYKDLLFDLLDSLTQWQEPLSSAIGILDVGLSSDTRLAISNRVTHIVNPAWDLAIDDELIKTKPHLRSLLARPFLREYFPGYDAYLWIDSDAWVQEKYAIKMLFDATKHDAMGLIPSLDRSYKYHPTHITWRKNNLLSYYGKEALELYEYHNYYNAGVFSLPADCPHWKIWENNFRNGLKKNPSIVSDQAALNYSIWKEKLKIYPLPALCNWLCHYAIPRFNLNTNKYHEPYLPNSSIGIIHMASKTKRLKFKIKNNGNEYNLALGFKRLQPLNK